MKTVRYTADAAKQLKRHGNVSARIRRAVNEYAAVWSAHANNVARLAGSTAIRMWVGDFRVIFEESETELLVTKVAPRGEAYD